MSQTAGDSKQVTSRFLSPAAGRIAFALALAVAAAAWQGCVMDAAPGSQSADSDPDAGAKTLLENPKAPPDGIPVGCSRQWSDIKHDSVLFCPDLRPPKP